MEKIGRKQGEVQRENKENNRRKWRENREKKGRKQGESREKL